MGYNAVMTEENSLIQGLREHRSAAMERFIGLYQSRVYSTALSFVKSESDAEEVTQDVFMAVWSSIEGFKGESSLTTWVYRIAVTRSLDLIKSRNRKKRFAFITSLTSDQNQIKHHPVDWVHPGVIEENREKAAYLFRAIDQLPENQRIAFTLSKIEQLSQKEIADVMKINEGAIESLLQRAKQNLRKYLDDIYEELK